MPSEIAIFILLSRPSLLFFAPKWLFREMSAPRDDVPLSPCPWSILYPSSFVRELPVQLQCVLEATSLSSTTRDGT